MKRIYLLVPVLVVGLLLFVHAKVAQPTAEAHEVQIDTLIPSSTSTLLPTTTVPKPTKMTILLTTPTATTSGLSDRETIVIKAAKAAAEIPEMQGSYSWENYRQCSTYASEYMRQLGFPVNGPFNHKSVHQNAFPWSNVVSQVNWLRVNYPGKVYDAPLSDFLNGDLWGKIPIGSLVYLQTAVGHNGYDTYYHVVVFISYTDNQPRFAEFSGDMKSGPVIDRTLSQMTRFISRLPSGGYDTRPFSGNINATPAVLLISWFDPLSVNP